MQIKVNGMMCEHCKKRVKTAVESVNGVKSVEIDLKSGMVTVEGVANEKEVKSSITACGYEVVE